MLAGFIGGFVDSAVGGGGLIRLPALLAAGLPSHVALATNKFGSTWAAGMSSAQYWMRIKYVVNVHGRKCRWAVIPKVFNAVD